MTSMPGFLTRMLATLAIMTAFAANAQAQADPRQGLAGMIQQLQTGRLNATWYTPQVWQVIATQTNNTGIYPDLVRLGAVMSIIVGEQYQLPAGAVYALTAQHQNGMSAWQLGIGTRSNRVEYFAFRINIANQPLPNPNPGPPMPSPNPAPTPPPVVGGGGTSDSGGGASEACRRFPNLC